MSAHRPEEVVLDEAVHYHKEAGLGGEEGLDENRDIVELRMRAARMGAWSMSETRNAPADGDEGTNGAMPRRRRRSRRAGAQGNGGTLTEVDFSAHTTQSKHSPPARRLRAMSSVVRCADSSEGGMEKSPWQLDTRMPCLIQWS